jgi:hypothetical protein
MCTDGVNTSTLRSQPQQHQYTYVTEINILMQLATMTFLFVSGKRKINEATTFLASILLLTFSGYGIRK